MAFSDILRVLMLDRAVMARLAIEKSATQTSLIILAVLAALYGIIAATFSDALLGGWIGTFIASTIIVWVLLVVGLAIGSGILRLIAMAFGGQGSFMGLYRNIGHAQPLMILSAIPIIGILASIYMVVVNIFIVQTVEKISMGRAVAVVLIPLVIVVALIMIIGIALFAALMSISSGAYV